MSDQEPLTYEQLDAARDTLIAVSNQVDDSEPSGLRTKSELQAVINVLFWPNNIPWLRAPEPTPSPVQSIIDRLLDAATAAEDGSPEEAILDAALRYAQQRPEWFGGDRSCVICRHNANPYFGEPTPTLMLREAARHAYYSRQRLAWRLLLAALDVANTYPHLFGEEK